MVISSKKKHQWRRGLLVPLYAPFCECKLVPFSAETRRETQPKVIERLQRDQELFAEQRLVMFEPFRRREDLRDANETWFKALMKWSSNAEFHKRAVSVMKFEINSYRHREDLVNQGIGGDETPEPSEAGGIDDDEADADAEEAPDPFLELLAAHPSAGFESAAVEAAHAAEHDWTHSTRPLSALDDSDLPWISAMRQRDGDEMQPDYAKYNPEDLKEYPEQRFAYELITRSARELLGGDTRSKHLIVAGPGGSGKSPVLIPPVLGHHRPPRRSLPHVLLPFFQALIFVPARHLTCPSFARSAPPLCGPSAFCGRHFVYLLCLHFCVALVLSCFFPQISIGSILIRFLGLGLFPHSPCIRHPQ